MPSKMKRNAAWIIAGLVAATGLASIALFSTGRLADVFYSTGRPLEEPMEISADRWIGTPNAPNEVVVFMSLTCDYCAEFLHGTVRSLLDREVAEGTVRLTILHFVDVRNIPGFMGARFAEHARFMGDDVFLDFIEDHTTSSLVSDSLGFVEWFDQRGLVLEKPDSSVRNQIGLDNGLGLYIGLRGVPSVVVNGRLYAGNRPPWVVRQHLRRRPVF